MFALCVLPVIHRGLTAYKGRGRQRILEAHEKGFDVDGRATRVDVESAAVSSSYFGANLIHGKSTGRTARECVPDSS